MNTDAKSVIDRTARDALTEHLEHKKAELASCTNWEGDAQTVERRISALRAEIKQTQMLVDNFDQLRSGLRFRKAVLVTGATVTFPVWGPVAGAVALGRACVN